MKILVCNSGSSSLKFSLIEAEREVVLAEGGIDWAIEPNQLVFRRQGEPEIREELRVRDHDEAFGRIAAHLQAGPCAPLGRLEEIDAIGHRVVCGGAQFIAATRITPEVERAIDELGELAPLHNPASLSAIRTIAAALPWVPQVAAFDTAFHATMPAAARTYALPRVWRQWGIRRYGFHGLSHAYCASRAAEILGDSACRLVIAHLGNGASVSAVRNGLCMDTSMGFTPLDGVVMGTRNGSLDPGVLLYLLRHKGMTAEELDHALQHESGLIGLSGFSSDMRDILKEAERNPDARLALEVYIHRLVQTIGAMAGTLGGVDGLVFTAGVGENSARVRELVCKNLGYLGLELDLLANTCRRADADVATPDSPARILVLATREDLVIARETSRLIRSEEREGGVAAKEQLPTTGVA